MAEANNHSADIRVGIVEDREPQRQDLVRLLSEANGLTCVAVASSAEAALEDFPAANPDIVLMDIRLPAMSGIECARLLKERLPKVQILMLTVVEDHEQIFKALAAGATGYLLKNTPPEKMTEAIKDLHQGGAPMSGQIARQVISAFQGSTLSPSGSKLSPVEQQVLQLLAKGLLYKEVADRIEVSLSTVRTHIWHIYTKLQVHNRTDAVRKGLRSGFDHT